MSEGMEVCSNCVREIPIANYGIHSAHCERNIQLCSLCHEPVPRSRFEEHRAEFHSIVTCTSCFFKLENAELIKHEEDGCPNRLVSCHYCDLNLKAKEMPEHENYCGSRTEICEGCGKLIILKSRKMHLDSNHSSLKENEEARSHSNNDGNDVLIVEDDEKSPRANRSCLQLDNGRIGQIFNRKTLTNRSSHQNFKQPDLIYLPCEFCHAPIIAYELALHQRGCGSPAASLKSRTPWRHSWRTQVPEDPVVYQISDDDENACCSNSLVNDQSTVDKKQNSVMIPCEFCSMPFPIDVVSNHQPICRDN